MRTLFLLALLVPLSMPAASAEPMNICQFDVYCPPPCDLALGATSLCMCDEAGCIPYAEVVPDPIIPGESIQFGEVNIKCDPLSTVCAYAGTELYCDRIDSAPDVVVKWGSGGGQSNSKQFGGTATVTGDVVSGTFKFGPMGSNGDEDEKTNVLFGNCSLNDEGEAAECAGAIVYQESTVTPSMPSLPPGVYYEMVGPTATSMDTECEISPHFLLEALE